MAYPMNDPSINNQDPAMQDQEQQFQMQNRLRQRMQQMGGVTPMNFNPQAQGAFGFAPSRPQEMPMTDNMAMAPPPESIAPQVPSYMQAQRNNMMQQRAMTNRNNMINARAPAMTPPSMAPPPGPDMGAYRANSPMPDFTGMRNAADAARGAATPGRPMGRVAAGLGAAGSAMGQANQARNKAKAKKKPANTSPMQMEAPPTFSSE